MNPDSGTAGARLQVQDVLGNRRVTVDRSPFTIGRRATNSLQLGATEVSREHAEIVLKEGRYLLRDCHSRYGTFVGGETITECELRHGDQIRLGRAGGAELQFLSEADAAPTSLDTAASRTDGLRQMSELLSQLRALGPGRMLQDVLALVLDTAVAVSRADRGVLMLAAPDGRLERRVARGPSGQALITEPFAISQKFPEEAFRTGRTCVATDLTAPDQARGHKETRQLGIRHVICIPLHHVRIRESASPESDDRRIGVVYLDGAGKGSLVSPGMQATLEALAAEASIAIENARLYRESLEKLRLEQEIRVAADIQRALLPSSSVKLPYLDAAAASIPCRSIGGDFFDYLQKDASSFGFTLGDVAGKGPSAALLSAMMQGMFAFAAQSPEAGDPGPIVAHINRALCVRAADLRFVTLFLGRLSRDGRLSYCNAGHPPPIVVGGSGVRRLRAGGPIVGLLERAEYEQETVLLEPGDMLVVFSDGVSEAFDAGESEFGEPRLLDVVQRTGARDAQAVVDDVLDAVRRFAAGAIQSDDITVLALRYLGDESPRIPAGPSPDAVD